MEIWDAYNEDGSMAGWDLIRGEIIPHGLFHLVCEVLVQHTDGSYLLMQRDYSKEGYPGMFEASAGGSVLKGETPEIGATRELYEETGIMAGDLLPIYKSLSENTIYRGFLCVTDCDKSSVVLQTGETIAYKWLPKDEFLKFIDSHEYIKAHKERLSPYLKTLNKNIFLANPTINDENAVLEFISEYKGYLPDSEDEERFEGVNDFSNIIDFKEWIQKVERFKYRESTPAHLVPQTLYLARDNDSGSIIGAITIRHYLNENLLWRGGHIGYGIRPSQRRKGYGSEMLRLALDKCKSMGIERVLITCRKGNRGSSKVIQSNGGVLENELWDQERNLTYLRYWFQL